MVALDSAYKIEVKYLCGVQSHNSSPTKPRLAVATDLQRAPDDPRQSAPGWATVEVDCSLTQTPR